MVTLTWARLHLCQCTAQPHSQYGGNSGCVMRTPTFLFWLNLHIHISLQPWIQSDLNKVKFFQSWTLSSIGLIFMILGSTHWIWWELELTYPVQSHACQPEPVHCIPREQCEQVRYVWITITNSAGTTTCPLKFFFSQGKLIFRKWPWSAWGHSPWSCLLPKCSEGTDWRYEQVVKAESRRVLWTHI